MKSVIDHIIYFVQVIVVCAVILAVVLFFVGVMEPLRHISFGP